MITYGSYVLVQIERLPETDERNYKLYCLPEGDNFKDSKNYDIVHAQTLKINGYAFSTAGAEISEHQEEVVVESDKDSMVNLKLEK